MTITKAAGWYNCLQEIIDQRLLSWDPVVVLVSLSLADLQ